VEWFVAKASACALLDLARTNSARVEAFATQTETCKAFRTTGEMFYQLSWTTLPGLRGLACSDFRATETSEPDQVRGVAAECASEAERDALVAQLEEHFSPQRFLNMSAAFDGVKDYVAQRAQR
jgi:hypothetical protein